MTETLVICLILTTMASVNSLPFCSSTCIDYSGACFDETPEGCWVCANHIFNFDSNLSSSTPCTVLNQSYIVASDLPNINMTLAGYTSTQVATKTCSNYTFSGQYTDLDYIAKNFTNIPLNHYAVVVRFNVGYIGTWFQTDYLRLNLQDSSQSIFYDYKYACQMPQNICGQVGVNTSDCIRIREYTMPHNSSYVFLNFSALTSQPDPSIQFWGIKEVIVAINLCHSYCLTCYNKSNANCLSCADGFYLQGNVCLPTCQNGLYTIYGQRICVNKCPSGYYGYQDTTGNGSKSCLSCSAGCILCTDSSSCQAWADVPAYLPNLWKDKLQFWILLIVIVLVAIILSVYKLIKWSINSKNNDLQEQMVVNGKQKNNSKVQTTQDKEQLIHHNNHKDPQYIQSQNLSDSLGPSISLKDGENLWFDQLLQMQPVEIKGRRKRNLNISFKPETDFDHDIKLINLVNPTSRASLDNS